LRSAGGLGDLVPRRCSLVRSRTYTWHLCRLTLSSSPLTFIFFPIFFLCNAHREGTGTDRIGELWAEKRGALDMSTHAELSKVQVNGRDGGDDGVFAIIP